MNYEKLAQACGMSNPRSASNAWSAIKKKIISKAGIVQENGDGGSSTPKATPKATPKKRGKKAAPEDGDDAEESPAKKVKGAKGKAAKKSEAKVEEDEDGVEEDEKKVKKEESGDEGEFEMN